MKSDQCYRILIIDDDQFLLEILRRFLQEAGIICHTAINGYEGRIKFEAMLPDLVIADLRMPGINGLETARRIRAIARRLQHQYKLVFLTADSKRSTVKIAKKLGVADFIKKPVRLSEFLARISQYKTNFEFESQRNKWKTYRAV